MINNCKITCPRMREIALAKRADQVPRGGHVQEGAKVDKKCCPDISPARSRPNNKWKK